MRVPKTDVSDNVRNRTTVKIIDIHSEQLQTWNDNNPKRAVKAGDHFVSVNGVAVFNAHTLKEELRKARRLHIKFRVGCDKTVMVDGTSGQSYGIGINNKCLPTALIVDTIDEGLVRSWNHQNPWAAVFPGDRIVEVNKARHVSDMIKELRKKQLLVLKCRDSSVLDMR